MVTKNCEPLVPALRQPCPVPLPGTRLTRSSIRHAQQEWPVVNFLEVLIFELLAVDAFTTCAIAFCEVSTLDHEALDDTVKARALVVKRLAGLANTLLAGA